MECVETLDLSGSGIREVPSSIEHFTKLRELRLYNCKNLRELPDSIYKLQQLREFWTSTAKLIPTCNSFDSSSGYGFLNMRTLNFQGYEAIIDLDLLMKPNYFPALVSIDLSGTDIVTTPESISRFPRLKSLDINDCKLLREIQGLPQSIMRVNARNCMLLDTQSPSGLLNQIIDIIGILPSRACGRARSNKLMYPQLTNYFPSESKGAEYEDGDISMDTPFSFNFPSEIEGAKSEDEYEFETETEGAESESESGAGIGCNIYFWGTEMPKWFNHQSVDNSIFFFVGRKFPKLVVCIDSGQGSAYGSVHISISGYKKLDLSCRLFSTHRGNNLHFFPLCQFTQQSLQRQLNASNPTDQNLVMVSITYDTRYSIKRWGVHVECTCPPQESANAPIKRCGVQDNVVEYLPTLKKQRTL